jgi:putative intracellular protease/amidase
METKRFRRSIALVIISEGFNEVEAICILSALRDAGIYAKSIGLTSGLIIGCHGILLMPDYTLGDLTKKINMPRISVVVLPGIERIFAKLELDPRVHRLLRQMLMQQGLIATNVKGHSMLKSALGSGHSIHDNYDGRILFRKSQEQSIDMFAQVIVQRLKKQ